MRVDASPALRAALLPWRQRRLALVICKTTYHLEPGTCSLADEPEAPNEHDTYWDDDPARSLASATDFTPLKPRADVVVVGSAYAAPGARVPSVIAHLVVGEVDKLVEVWSDRWWTADEELRHGPPFDKMSLRYERAAGGRDTANPVGVPHRAPPNARGLVPIPNLQLVGLHVSSPTVFITPVGFGPIAPTWPGRQEQLGPLAGRWIPDRWFEADLPPAVPAGFFNCAPRDQQLAELRPDEPIILEHLSPDQQRLVTRLPGLRPSARRHGGPPIPLRADTLWIDTDRRIVTVTWRGEVVVATDRDEAALRVSVELEPPTRAARGPDEFVDPSGLPRMPGSDDDAAKTSILPPPAKAQVDLDVARTALPDPRPAAPVLPFSGGGAPSRPPPGQPPVQRPVSRMPPPVAPLFPEPAPPSPARPPDASPWRTPGGAGQHAAAPVALPANARVGDAVKGGAAAASDAAAQASQPPPATPPEPSAAGPAARAPARGATTSREVLRLLWFDPASPNRVRKTWRRIVTEHDLRPPTDAEDLDGDAEDEALQNRRRIHEVLARGAVGDARAVEGAFAAAVDAFGAFDPPLVLLGGEVEMVFDPTEALRATLSVVSPFAGTDKKLKEAVEAAGELARSPGTDGNGVVAEQLVANLVAAFAEGRRSLPQGYLDAQTERVLVERRAFERTKLHGVPWLRARLWFSPGEAAPLFVLESGAGELPMLRRFRARVIAEVDVPQDATTVGYVLKVVALARVLDLKAQPARRESGV